ncbi:GNAT family N-acetyltransferase [Stenotrophomonas sp. ZAC14D2_NAIMI4_7]|uniref:GNAT family N-acetyltransferase n=1 Tax=Stenotrophomonas sp. ZAC14D2_NAIMI4_7 TaxID=2072405 RepID=UPI000D542B71|nr:GNAT family N-acetyltransferase [Stenotrophomonas sp. ZAC14D2_NAIMI4_7]AWH17653.1 GNAT family N-acetyltransferase [Stenotrophomonas sp. ZAC14D2_NAIMI4_7]
MESQDGVALMPATPEEVEHLCTSLQQFNGPFTGGCQEAELRLVARDAQGALLGGILAEVALGWLEIHVLWVEPAQRSTALGAALLEVCEQRACALGAHSARLDTFDWQAEGFYARHDYRVFARLEDYPAGHARVFMSKRLA